MSRILFAAARGARIQCKDFRGSWSVMKWVPAADFDIGIPPRRIHPDDAHLQYGPISTALREIAETLNALSPAIVWGAFVDACGDEMPPIFNNKLHHSLFMLILSEALADEGL